MSDWSSDVCSSDLIRRAGRAKGLSAGNKKAANASASAAPSMDGLFVRLHAVDDFLLRCRGVAPAGELDPLALFQRFVAAVEVLDLVLDALRHVDRKSTRLNSSPKCAYRMPSSSCKKQHK